jgi:hypothetical protein
MDINKTIISLPENLFWGTKTLSKDFKWIAAHTGLNSKFIPTWIN